MIELNGNNLTIEKVWRVACGDHFCVSSEAMQRVKASRDIVDRLVEENRVVYGITTGFGHLCNTRINRSDLERL